MKSWLTFMLGSLLFFLSYISVVHARDKASIKIELPYRIFQNQSKLQILLIGSSHAPLGGVSNISTSTKNMLVSASMVAFEAHPNAPPVTWIPPSIRSYVDAEKFKRLEQLARREKFTAWVWQLVNIVPMPPELVAGMFFSNCMPDRFKEHLYADKSSRKSLDRLALEVIGEEVNSVALESVVELNDLRTENSLQDSSIMIEAALNSALSQRGCDVFRTYQAEIDRLVISRNIDKLYDISWRYECILFSCRGFLNGIAVSKERNVRLADRMISLVREHNRLAVIVGALHLDRRAGLLEELNGRGFFEVENNLTQ